MATNPRDRYRSKTKGEHQKNIEPIVDAMKAKPKENDEAKTTAKSQEDPKSPPLVVNEYVGDVLGNVLDRYDNPTYNLKLYMIGPGEKNTSAGTENTTNQNTEDSDSEDAKQTQGKPGSLTTSGSGYLNNSVDAEPENTVVLAQTGVTEVGIDNLEIVTVPTNGASIGSTVNFTITQPNAADFPDQIVKAREFLGAPPDAADCPFFLEITFRGYKESNEDSDNWNTDAGGEPVTIAGPFVYQLLLGNFTMSINEQGSTYDFSTVIKDDTYKADGFFRTKEYMTITGNTIGEMLLDLQKQQNNANIKAERLERIDFGIGEDGNVAGLDIADQTFDVENADNTAKLINPKVEETEDTDEAKEAAESKRLNYTQIQKNPETNAIQVSLKEGIALDKVLGILLSMNKEFMSKAIRSDIEKTEGEKSDVKSTKEIMWYEFSGSVSYGEYIIKDGKHIKTAHLIPRTFLSNKTDIAVFPHDIEANNELSKQDMRQRVNQMNIRKAYEYIFTGRNDQILNLDIEFKEGIALLLPPERGMLGDISQNASHILNSTPVDKDESLDKKGVDKLKEEAQKQGGSFFDQLKKFKDDIEKGQQFLNDLGNAANFTQSEIKNLIQDQAGAAAQKLQDVLSTQATAQAVADNLTKNAKASPQANVVTQSEEFSPSSSGFVYGGDLVGNNKYTEQISESSSKRESATKDVSTTNSSDEPEDARHKTAVVQRKEYLHKSGFANVGTTKGIKNNLFTYLYDQHQAIEFLMKLDIQLRGDPYWLGKAEHKFGDKQQTGMPADKIEQSKEDNDNYLETATDAFFLFSLNSPRLFDPDVVNEDNNTGLWIKEGDGTSYFISGIYRVRKVVHNFSSGEYKMDVESVKETAISLNNLDRAKSKFSYVDETRRGFAARNQDGVATESDFDNNKNDTDYRVVEGVYTAEENKDKSVGQLLQEGKITQAQHDSYIRKFGDNG